MKKMKGLKKKRKKSNEVNPFLALIGVYEKKKRQKKVRRKKTKLKKKEKYPKGHKPIKKILG